MRNTIILPPNSDTVLNKVSKPLIGYTYIESNGIGAMFRAPSRGELFIKAPYTIGQVVAVREAYYIEDVGNGTCIVYKSDAPNYPLGSDTWRSPATMPLSACRRKVEITAVDVVEKDGVFYWKIGNKPHSLTGNELL